MEAGPGDCKVDPRVDPYMPNLVKPGDNGALLFQIVQSEPGPPKLGDNKFTVKVTDMSGMALMVDLRVDVILVDRNQPSSVDPLVTFDAASGIYTIAPIAMQLPGLWRVGLDAQSDSDAGVTSDVVAFHFCIAS